MICAECDVEWSRAGKDVTTCWLCEREGSATPPEHWPKWTSQFPDSTDYRHVQGILTL